MGIQEVATVTKRKRENNTIHTYLGIQAVASLEVEWVIDEDVLQCREGKALV